MRNNKKQSATIAASLKRLLKNVEQFNNGIEIVFHTQQYKHTLITNKKG